MNAELKTSLACCKTSRVRLRYGGQSYRKYWYDPTLSGRLRPSALSNPDRLRRWPEASVSLMLRRAR